MRERGRRFMPGVLVMTGILFMGLAAAFMPSHARAAGDADGRTFTIASGGYSLNAPEGWQRVQPKSNMIETEFAIPPAAEGEQPGRMTVMGAGGSVQANVDRWYGQFTQPDGSNTKDKSTTKSLKLADTSVTLVDIPGTYKDMPGGPFAGGKSVEKPGYRMLAAIIETPDAGSYFLKFYGPAECVSKHADGFRSMIEGIVASQPAQAR